MNSPQRNGFPFSYLDFCDLVPHIPPTLLQIPLADPFTMEITSWQQGPEGVGNTMDNLRWVERENKFWERNATVSPSRIGEGWGTMKWRRVLADSGRLNEMNVLMAWIISACGRHKNSHLIGKKNVDFNTWHPCPHPPPVFLACFSILDLVFLL